MNKSCRMCGEVFGGEIDKCPACGGTDTDEVLGEVEEKPSIVDEAELFAGPRVAGGTEELEAELRDLSAQLTAGQGRFHQVRAELRRRRETRDEQPSQEKPEAKGDDVVNVLTNKIIAMESEQAKLVVEAEVAKAAQREAEERLALVAKRLPAKREPMSREVATELLVNCMRGSYGDPNMAAPTTMLPWVVDAVVEASK